MKRVDHQVHNYGPYPVSIFNRPNLIAMWQVFEPVDEVNDLTFNEVCDKMAKPRRETDDRGQYYIDSGKNSSSVPYLFPS